MLSNISLTPLEETMIKALNRSYLLGEEYRLKSRPNDPFIQAEQVNGCLSLYPFASGAVEEKEIKALKKKGALIDFSRSEVGALFIFPHQMTGTVTVDYLLDLPNRRNLTFAQTSEVERLLNKVGQSLGLSLPPVPTPTDKELQDMLNEMLRDIINSKPVKYHKEFKDLIASKGFLSDMGKDDFLIFVQKHIS